MSIYEARVIDVFVNSEGFDGPAPPVVFIEVQILDDDVCKKHTNKGRVKLSFSPWDFKFPPGSDIISCMNEFAKAWMSHKGNVINIDIPDVTIKK